MPEPPIIKGHPLDGADEDKCYEVLLSERNALVAAKQRAEDELIKNIIKMSSSALLIVPGLGASHAFPLTSIAGFFVICGGLLAFASAMVAGLLEQWLSSKAYNSQILAMVEYYSRRSQETHNKHAARRVERAQGATLLFFFIAVGLTAAGFALEVKTDIMAHKPSPPTSPSRPSPPPRPAPSPGHKGDVPGRSVPPSAPPPPPSKK